MLDHQENFKKYMEDNNSRQFYHYSWNYVNKLASRYLSTIDDIKMLDKFYVMIDDLNDQLKLLKEKEGIKKEEWEYLGQLKYTMYP